MLCFLLKSTDDVQTKNLGGTLHRNGINQVKGLLNKHYKKSVTNNVGGKEKGTANWLPHNLTSSYAVADCSL